MLTYVNYPKVKRGYLAYNCNFGVKYLFISLTRLIQSLVILLIVLANLSFASAVVEEIVDHNVTLASEDYSDHISLLEDIDFDVNLDIKELDEPNLTSSTRRMESEQSMLRWSDIPSFELLYTPLLAVKMKVKEISFIDKTVVKSRTEYFAIHRMCPF